MVRLVGVAKKRCQAQLLVSRPKLQEVYSSSCLQYLGDGARMILLVSYIAKLQCSDILAVAWLNPSKLYRIDSAS